ncbi:hypothetical protein [Cognatilysobacter tabacisoli]|uniref:hypothetical protein n=1 Tax=Cognatilysobacter tabacisoli TaxID=2315424 RepID=UPI000E6B24F0|nr:hypothetical protein [Lysobacter tabacisoli]
MTDPRRLVACLALVAALAACRASDPAPASKADAAPTGPTAAPTTAPAPTPSPPAAPAASPADEPAPATTLQLALDGEGLRLVDPASGATRPLAFGQPIAPVIDAVRRSQGTAPTQSTNGECGAGALDMATWPDGLTLVSQGGTFRGWSLNPRSGTDASARPTTMAGIGLGSTRAELDVAYNATITPSSLGTEFAAGGLYGVLGSARADAPITALWAGTSCVFR